MSLLAARTGGWPGETCMLFHAISIQCTHMPTHMHTTHNTVFPRPLMHTMHSPSRTHLVLHTTRMMLHQVRPGPVCIPLQGAALPQVCSARCRLPRQLPTICLCQRRRHVPCVPWARVCRPHDQPTHRAGQGTAWALCGQLIRRAGRGVPSQPAMAI